MTHLIVALCMAGSLSACVKITSRTRAVATSTDTAQDTSQLPSSAPSGTGSSPESTTAIQEQKVVASESSGAKGSYVVVPPGAVAVGTEIILEAGTDLVTESVISDLGLDASAVQSPASKPVMVTTSGSADLAGDIAIAIPLDDESLQLLQSTAKYEFLVVFYKVKIAGESGKFRLGILARELLTVEEGMVKFKTKEVGTFQAGYLTVSMSAKAAPSVISAVPMLSKTEAEAAPATSWQFTAEPRPGRQMLISFNLTGLERIESCHAAIDGDQQFPVDETISLATDQVLVVAPVSENEHSRFVRFRCRDAKGRESVSEWQKLEFAAAMPTNSSTATTSDGDSADADGSDTSTGTVVDVDSTPPENPQISVSSGNALSIDATVSLGLSATGASEMYITNTAGCGSGGSWESYGTSKGGWSLAQTNATATVYVKYRDAAGNESACVSDSIVHDDTAPSGGSLEIAGNAAYATTASVSLGLSATGASEMYITNTAGCGSGGSWESYGTSKGGWSLAQTNATATVYVKYRDAAGNESACVSDSIVHDDTAPTGFSITSPSFSDVFNTSPQLIWNGSSDSNGVTYSVRVSTANTCASTGDDLALTGATGLAGTSYTVAPALSSGTTYYACVVASDPAGNQALTASKSMQVQTPAFTCDSGDHDTTCTINSAKSISSGTVAATNGNLVLNAALSVAASPYLGTVTVGGDLTINAAGSLVGNFTVNADNLTFFGAGFISANNLGYAGGVTSSDAGAGAGGGNPGGGNAGGGGAHAGAGGAASAGGAAQSSVYGSSNDPTSYGSGGGGGFSAGQGTESGGAGGGAIVINVTGLTTFEATSKISANGQARTKNGGAGAGGSIKLVTGSLSGTGTIEAKGGQGGTMAPYGGGGGGGRIRIESGNKYLGLLYVSGGAAGGGAATAGSDGSYTQSIANLCDSGSNATGQTCAITQRTWVGTSEALTFAGSLTLNGSETIRPVSTNGSYSLLVTQTFTLASGTTWKPSYVTMNAADVLSELRADVMSIQGTMEGNFPLIEARTLSLSASGWIKADGWGFAGSSTSSTGGGAGGGGAQGGGGAHCGNGGSYSSITGGTAYGDIEFPTTYGSGGGGNGGVQAGHGGGRIKIVARTSVTMVSGSKITSAGTAGASNAFDTGGGAGGSVLIDTGTLTFPAGATIGAPGGNSGSWSATSYGGGGGGGCVALYRRYAASGGTFNTTGGTGEGAGGGSSGAHQERDLEGVGQFRKLFVTSGTYGMSAGVAALNGHCSTEASNAGLYTGASGVTWKALLSTGSVNASTLLTTENVTNARAEWVGSGSADLFDGSIASAIKYDASGQAVSDGVEIATGSDSDGTLYTSDNCSDFTSTAGSLSQGNYALTTGAWMRGTSGSCAGSYHLYCITQ